MAAGTPLPPPPGIADTAGATDAAGAGNPNAPPPGPDAAAPAQGMPSPQLQQGTQLLIQTVNNLRTIAKAFPQTAPHITEINQLMRQVAMAMMQSQEPGQPAAPPA